jgi:hypothetical protein
MQFDCGTRILRVISRAGRPCHLSKLHQDPERTHPCVRFAGISACDVQIISWQSAPSKL